jgi:signal transduction histidine kinase
MVSLSVFDSIISIIITGFKARLGKIRHYRVFAQCASVIAMFVGTLFLVGWAFDLPALKSLPAELAPMYPTTATCFVALGVALWLSRTQSSQRGGANLQRKVAAQACALFAALVGLVTLGEYLLGMNVGIDELLFRKALTLVQVPFPGRMAHLTGLEFVVLGAALVLLNAKSWSSQRLALYFALVGTVIGLITLVGYAYGAKALYRISTFSSVELQTALLFTLLGFAILCARPNHGPLSTVINRNLGGSIARLILPAVLTLPFVIGWLRLQGQHAGLYGTEFGSAISTISNDLIFAVLVWLGSRSLNKAVAASLRSTTQLKGANEELKTLNESLEQRVRDRTAELRATNIDLQTEVAERTKIEQVLHERNIELQNAAEAKDRFLANMSHELRTPLNGILGFAEFLVDGKPGKVNPKQKEYLEDILNSGKHLLQLISDVLDLAKMGAGKMELSPEKFSLGQAVEEVCAVTKPIAEKKSIQIEVHIAPEITDVTLDKQKIKQILYNLLSNAIKFNHEGGKVFIRAEPHETDRVKLVVRDTGVGIKAEDSGRLFKEFEQLDSGASRHYEGTGLGLALTRKIVELQGGTIEMESEVGQGSTFTVILPSVLGEGNLWTAPS